MRKVVLIGAPGVDVLGPAECMAAASGMTVVVLRDLFQSEFRLRTALSERIQPFFDAEAPLPIDLVGTLLAGALYDADGGWVLNNFPRTVEHAELLEELRQKPDVVIELVLTDDEIDLVPPLLPERFARVRQLRPWYQEHVEPLRAYYRVRGVFRTVSGFGEPGDVAARLTTTV